MKSIEITGLPFEELDATPEGLPIGRALLEQFDAHLRAQLAQLPSVSYWRIMSHPGVTYYLEAMSDPQDLSDETYGALLNAIEYRLRHEQKRLERKH